MIDSRTEDIDHVLTRNNRPKIPKLVGSRLRCVGVLEGQRMKCEILVGAQGIEVRGSQESCLVDGSVIDGLHETVFLFRDIGVENAH